MWGIWGITGIPSRDRNTYMELNSTFAVSLNAFGLFCMGFTRVHSCTSIQYYAASFASRVGASRAAILISLYRFDDVNIFAYSVSSRACVLYAFAGERRVRHSEVPHSKRALGDLPSQIYRRSTCGLEPGSNEGNLAIQQHDVERAHPQHTVARCLWLCWRQSCGLSAAVPRL